MARPPAGHGYIDFIGDEEWFWRIETLWAAANARAPRDVDIEELPWRDDGCFVLGDPPKWGAVVEHCKRAMEVDLSYPIILGPKGSIMDGMHRIMRAYIEGRTTVSVVQLDAFPPPDRVRPRQS